MSNDFYLEDDHVGMQINANTTAAERAVINVEAARRVFYDNLEVWNAQKEGGARYNAIVRSNGREAADLMAKHTEQNFRGFLAQAMLTEDGQTTDPSVPVDKMHNHELRRIRVKIITHVHNFYYHISEMLDDDPMKWMPLELHMYLGNYVYRYMFQVFGTINKVIPNRRLRSRSPEELRVFLETLAKRYSSFTQLDGYTKEMILKQVCDQHTEFLLMEIPYNVQRMDAKEDVVPGVKAVQPEDKLILH